MSKYRNKPVVVDGHRFPSKREANRYGELRCLLQAGYVRDLELQPSFPMRVNGTLVCTYVADFRYWDCKAGGWVVEDAKGVRTRDYVIKKKLLLALHGISVVEV